MNPRPPALAIGVLLLLAACSPVLAANEYQIEMSIHPESGKLHGVEKVVYRNETEAPLDTLFLEAPGLPGNPAIPGNDRWKIFSLEDAKGGRPTPVWVPEEEAYRIPLSSPLGAGFKTTFTIEYERDLSPADRTPGYLDLSDRGSAGWYLKFRAYRAGSLGTDDFKDISVSLTLPAGWTAAGTGAPPLDKRAAAGRTVLVEKSARNFALALGDRLRILGGSAGKTGLSAGYLEGQESWAKLALGEATDAIQYYQAFLGAYPPTHVTLLPVPPGSITGASSTNVIYAPVTTNPEVLRGAVSLEAARLVWGWSVGDPSDSTPFVGNGLAIWCQQNYLAKRNGLDLHAQYLRSRINDTYLAGVLRGYDTTVLRTKAERSRFDWNFDRIVAQAKSAAVMHMLGGLIGSEKLQQVIQGILKSSPQAIFTDRDFQKAAQAASTAKLDGFFDQFLRGKDTLDYNLGHVRVVKTESGYEVHADVFKTGTASMPVEVVVTDAAGARVRSIFPADRASGEMAIPIKAPLASIALDPLQILPMSSRVGPAGRLDLAEILLGEAKLLRADEQIDQAGRDTPPDARAAYLRGRVMKERGDWTGALAQWSKSISLAAAPDDPARVWSQIWTARILDLQGRRDEAIPLYTSVAALPDVRGSAAAAAAGLHEPYTDTWPPALP